MNEEARAEACRLYTMYLVHIHQSGGDLVDVEAIADVVENNSIAYLRMQEAEDRKFAETGEV